MTQVDGEDQEMSGGGGVIVDPAMGGLLGLLHAMRTAVRRVAGRLTGQQ